MPFLDPTATAVRTPSLLLIHFRVPSVVSVRLGTSSDHRPAEVSFHAGFGTFLHTARVCSQCQWSRKVKTRHQAEGTMTSFSAVLGSIHFFNRPQILEKAEGALRTSIAG